MLARLRRSSLPALVVLVLGILGSEIGVAALRTSSQSGNWNSTATWGGAAVPIAGDDVTIANGHTVTINANTASIRILIINAGGTLRGDGTAGRTLTVGRNSGTEDVTINGTLNLAGANSATVTLSVNSQWGGSGSCSLSDMNLNTRTLNFTAGTTMTINMSAATPFTNAGTVNSLSTITWNFNGTSLQTLPTSANVKYGAITVNNTAGVTLGVALSATSILDNISVQTGTLNNGGFAIVGNTGKTFSVSSGATFNLTGTSTMVTGFSTKTFGATSTVNYSGGAQTVTAESYGHLTLSGTTAKTMPASTMTIAGNLTTGGSVTPTLGGATTVNGNLVIGSGTTLSGSSFTHGVKGNFTNNGTYTAGTSTITLDGTGSQTIGGSSVTTFNNLTIANTTVAVGASLNFNVTGTMTVNANATLTPTAAMVVNSAAPQGTVTGSGTITVTRTNATADYSNQYRFSTNTLTGLTVDYNGIGQTLSNLTYGNLRVSGSITGANNNATVGGVFTTTGTFTPTSGTVTMNNGSSIVNSGTLTFSNLTVAAAATVTTSSSFNVSGTMTVNAGGIFVPAAASVINSAAQGTITGSGTVRVTRTATTADYSTQYKFSTNTLANLTVEYVGAAAQIVSSLTYGNLTINNSNGVTLAGNATVSGTLTMTSGNIGYTAASDELIIGTGTSQLGTLVRTAGIVLGRVKRWFANATVNNVVFPVGVSTHYRPAVVSYTSAPVAGGTLTCWFVSSDPLENGFTLDDAGTTLTKTAPDGYWTITVGNSLTAGNYSLDLTAAGFNGVTNVPSLRIVKRANAASVWTLDGTHSAGTGTTTTPIAHRTGMGGFSDFAIASPDDNPLPVELTKFELKPIDDAVHLSWQTGSEIDNAGFEIQRADLYDLSFQLIASYRQDEELQGLGTSPVGKSYSWVDGSLAQGDYLYKLIDVSNDGTRTEHPAREVHVGGAGDGLRIETVQPNPARGEIEIGFSVAGEEEVAVEIYSVEGKLMGRFPIERYEGGVHRRKISLDGIGPGAYMLQVTTAKHRRIRPLVVVP